jgi:hypothetical protein
MRYDSDALRHVAVPILAINAAPKVMLARGRCDGMIFGVLDGKLTRSQNNQARSLDIIVRGVFHPELN